MAKETVKKVKKDEEVKKVKSTATKSKAAPKVKEKVTKPVVEKKSTAKKSETKKVSAKPEKKTSAKKSRATAKKTPTKAKKEVKMEAEKKEKAPAKKAVSKKAETKPVNKETKKDTTSSKKTVTTKKATSATTKKASTKTKKEVKVEAETKKAPTKKATTSKKTVATKKETSTTKKIKSTAKPMLAEYYDLPYRYNETVVKILAQTPTTLFVYWDISDDDRNKLLGQHGDNMFYETRPILIIHNTTHNYSFEVEINDFANSWYIRTQEPDCDYVIELGRRVIDRPNEYIYINSSNNIISPNNHILFENSDLGHVLFRNVKTNVLSTKDFGSLRFINDMDKLYGNIYDVYGRLYKDTDLDELLMPSSGEFIK